MTGFFFTRVQLTCLETPNKSTTSSRAANSSGGFVRPAGSFDGVHFVGQSWVSVWVFDIGDGNNGVVLVDGLNNPGRRQGRGASGPGRVRVQGLRHQGRLISITHKHADHDGGLRYLQDTVGMPAYATKDVWEGALGRRSRRSQGAGAAVPERDPDGRELTGRSASSSLVVDNSQEHLAGFYSGDKIPAAAKAMGQQIASFQKFAAKTEKGADVPMSCHETQDNSIYDFDVMAAGAAATNSFVIGTRVYVRYLKTMSLCVRVKVARDEQGAAAAG
ncbi:hypothetical protein ACKVV7_001513 [Pyricularia oryzae]